MKTLCLIPVYNEDTKLIELINQIKKYKSKNNNVNYLFINNGSTDKSFYLIKKNKFKFINLKKNYGVGYALIVGYLHAKKNKYDSVIHLAGNGKMHPKYISKILKYLYVLNYDFVSGSRFLKNSTHKNNPLYRIILIKIFSIFLKIILNYNITDATCGYRGFKINIFKNYKKTFFKKKLFTYGYEYYSYGKVLRNKNIRTKEISVSMNYPSKKNYTKIRPVIDWFVMAKFWLIGYYENDKI
jgi:glycosyltransferase involved in cell wall biosynthesis